MFVWEYVFNEQRFLLETSLYEHGIGQRLQPTMTFEFVNCGCIGMSSIGDQIDAYADFRTWVDASCVGRLGSYACAGHDVCMGKLDKSREFVLMSTTLKPWMRQGCQ